MIRPLAWLIWGVGFVLMLCALFLMEPGAGKGVVLGLALTAMCAANPIERWLSYRRADRR